MTLSLAPFVAENNAFIQTDIGQSKSPFAAANQEGYIKS